MKSEVTQSDNENAKVALNDFRKRENQREQKCVGKVNLIDQELRAKLRSPLS
jgi:hypothetical protein